MSTVQLPLVESSNGFCCAQSVLEQEAKVAGFKSEVVKAQVMPLSCLCAHGRRCCCASRCQQLC